MDVPYFNWFTLNSVHVWLFVTLWTAAHQASLSITSSRSLLKPMSIELVMPSNHLILSCPLLLRASIFPSITVFCNESDSGFMWQCKEYDPIWDHSVVPCIGVSASASVLPMNIWDWFPLGLTGWISLQSKGLSRVVSNTTVQKHHFFFVFVLSFLYSPTLTSIHDY